MSVTLYPNLSPYLVVTILVLELLSNLYFFHELFENGFFGKCSTEISNTSEIEHAVFRLIFLVSAETGWFML